MAAGPVRGGPHGDTQADCYRGEMSDQHFAFLHLEGGRFEENPGTLPVECLHEIANYRRCVASLASDAWRMDHPERERLPKKFTQDFQLSLTGIGSGSALPYVDRQAVDLGLDGYFEAARDKFTLLLDQLRQGQSGLTSASRSTLKLVRAFGRSFRAKETITLGHPRDEGRRVSLDAAGRARLHTLDLSEATTTRNASLLGTIAGWNIEGRSFDLRHEGRLVKGATFGTSTDIGNFVSNGKSVPVVATGKLRFSADGVAVAFESHVELENASAVLAYLDTALSPEKTSTVNDTVVGIVRRWTPSWLRVAPRFGVAVAGSNVRVEWELDGWDCSIEIGTDGTMYAHRYRAENDEDVELELASFDGKEAASLVANWTVGAW